MRTPRAIYDVGIAYERTFDVELVFVEHCQVHTGMRLVMGETHEVT